MLFKLSANELLKHLSKDECDNEPSYKHLYDIA